jgi:hypothetical protein
MSFGFSIHLTLTLYLFLTYLLGSTMSAASSSGYSFYKLRQSLDEVEKESENVPPQFLIQGDLLRHKSVSVMSQSKLLYSVFQGFSKAKSANGGSILSSSQFLVLPQLPQKMKLASKVVKVDSKIIISLPKI